MMTASINTQGKQTSGIWLPVVIVLILAVGAYYYLNVYQKEQVESAAATSVLPETPPALPVQSPPERSEAETESGLVNEPLQTPLEAPVQNEVQVLDDEQAKAIAEDLVGEDRVRNYLLTEGLMAKLVAMVDALGSDQVPGNIIPVVGPGGEVLVTSNGVSETINPETGLPEPLYLFDPVNFQRYTPQVDVLEAIDMTVLVENYNLYYPQLQQAYRELGYPNGSFEERLLEVISELLATPEPQEPVVLVKPEAFYQFVNPDYEALSAGQKILLRSGPSNAARIKAVLSELQSAIQTQRE